jgi:hypothetical protein
MRQSSTRYVTGVAQLLFSLGIPGIEARNVSLVQPIDDAKRDGNRPFSVTTDFVSMISKHLDFNMKSLSLAEFSTKVPTISPEDILDIQIISRLGKLRLGKLPIILAAQIEHVNLVRPNILHLHTRSLIKRYDLNRKLLLPNRIRKFYTLAPQPRRHPILDEKSLDHGVILDKCKEINDLLAREAAFKQLFEKIGSSARATLIILPKAKHFGGSTEFNELMFRSIAEIIKDGSIRFIMIKNHPSDDSDYSDIAIRNFPNVDFVCLNDLIDRSYPLELLATYFSDFSIAGVESTSSILLQRIVRSQTLIFDTRQHNNTKHQQYDSGEIRSMYPHRLILI